MTTILRVALPLIVGQASVAVMQITDAFLVSRLGDAYLAALSPAGMLLLVIVDFGRGYIAAGTAFISQSYGAGNTSDAVGFTVQLLYFSVALGLGFLAFLPTSRVVLGLLRLEPLVFETAVSYFNICLFSLLPMLVSATLDGFFTSIRRPTIPMYVNLGSLVVNFAISFCLIRGELGLPRMGASGAALGTVIATSLNAAVLLVIFITRDGRKAVIMKALRPNWLRQREIAVVGIPSGTQWMVDVFSWGVLIVALVSVFGTAHLAAGTVILRCVHLSFLPIDGVGRAINVLTGQAIGLGNYRKAMGQTLTAVRISSLYMLLVGSLYFLFREQILRIFTDDPFIIAIGASSMVFVAAFQFFDGLNITYVNALQGAGDTIWASLVTIALALLVLVGGGVAVIVFFPQWGSQGIWAVAAVFICLQGIAFARRWKQGAWKSVSLLG